ncbi:MAG: pilus assembly protein [Acidobacteria bacterium]|nr:pilus assembly protein [Acidobacteriota bacterium]
MKTNRIPLPKGNATRRAGNRGSAVLELALVLLPFFFGVAVTMEVARWMWTYHTLTSATKAATRYAIVHGARCAEASADCIATVGDVSRLMLRNGVGLDGNNLQITLNAGQSTRTCSPAAHCLTDVSPWPAAGHNAAGLPVTITASYGFSSVLAVIWPGQTLNNLRLSAKSTEAIQF